MDQLSCNLTWKSFNQYYAQHAKHGIIAELDCGVTVYWTQSNLLFMNAFFLSSAVSDEADLRRRLEGIKAYVTKARPAFPWAIMIEPELLPADLRERTQEICLAADFIHVGNFKCMHTSSFLPPERSVNNIEIKFATSEQDIHDALLLNVHAHHMDTSIAKNVVENRTALVNFEKEICCIVYIDEKPVATATTLLLDNCLCVILVATSEQHRKQGYAEVALRSSVERALEKLPHKNSDVVLHATELGWPVYKRIGFKDITHIEMYVPKPAEPT